MSPTEDRIAEEVAKMEAAKQLAQFVAGLKDGIAGCGRAEAAERLRRRIPTMLDRRAEPQQSVQLDWSRAALDSASLAAKKGAPRSARTRRIAAGPARSATLSRMPAARRSASR